MPEQLTQAHKDALLAFMEAFDMTTTGAWNAIADHMIEAGIADPDGDLEAAKEALR